MLNPSENSGLDLWLNLLLLKTRLDDHSFEELISVRMRGFFQDPHLRPGRTILSPIFSLERI